MFRTRLDRSWGPPFLLHNRYRVYIPEVRPPRRDFGHPAPSSTEVEERIELIQNFSGVMIVKNEMGGACSAYEGEERRIVGLGGET